MIPTPLNPEYLHMVTEIRKCFEDHGLDTLNFRFVPIKEKNSLFATFPGTPIKDMWFDMSETCDAVLQSVTDEVKALKLLGEI